MKRKAVVAWGFIVFMKLITNTIMNKTFFSALAFIATFAVSATANDYKGSQPASGHSYKLYNVGTKQFLGIADGQLSLGGDAVAVGLDAVENTKTPGFYRLNANGAELTADLSGAMSLAGGKFDEWRIEPVNGKENVYTISSRNTEASASYYIYQSSVYNRLAAMPQQPAGEFEAAQWLLVDAAEVETPQYEFKENDATYERHDDAYASVHLYRNFTLNHWNTFCSPVDISEEQLKEQFGDDVHVAELTGYNGSELNFTTTHSVKAGMPCIVNPTKGTNDYYSFMGDMTFAPKAESVTIKGVTFTGTLAAVQPTDKDYVFNSATSAAESAKGKIGGMSAYFTLKYATSEINSWTLDGTTSIGSIHTGDSKSGDIYGIGGEKVKSGATSADGLQRGVYIMKGKKVTKK